MEETSLAALGQIDNPPDKTWTEFSILEVAVCMWCTRVGFKLNDLT
jgi:hypothetical protein